MPEAAAAASVTRVPAQPHEREPSVVRPLVASPAAAAGLADDGRAEERRDQECLPPAAERHERIMPPA